MRLQLILFLSIFLLAINSNQAQVTFIIGTLPVNTPAQDTLYIAGDFNGWNPGDPEYQLHRNGDGKWEITLAGQSEGTIIHFKFTRGSWLKVEKGEMGEEIPDRAFTFGNGQVEMVVVYNWADIGSGNTTAASNVTILNSAFYMPQLERSRRIWLYLPPDYASSGMSYPVLYMHDGQNLFDQYTSFAGEWEVDETLNTLNSQGYQVPIVIGIDNGGNERINEYSPWNNPTYGGGEGENYIQFITETLKPYVDQQFRTLPDRNNTGLMGSSLGGSVTLYGGLHFQEVFGKLGLFSPAYWFSDSIWDFAQMEGQREYLRFYQLYGSNESVGMAGDIQRMNDTLVSIGFSQDQVSNTVIQGGQHNEQLWRENFRDAYLWLFNSYANSVAEPINREIRIYPNPATHYLFVSLPEPVASTNLYIADISGRVVKKKVTSGEKGISVQDLQPGIYMLMIDNGSLPLKYLRFIKI